MDNWERNEYALQEEFYASAAISAGEYREAVEHLSLAADLYTSSAASSNPIASSVASARLKEIEQAARAAAVLCEPKPDW